MEIMVVGTGYVGLVTGACLSAFGNDVWCIDVDKNKINSLKKGHITIYEPGLNEIVKKNYKAKRLHFTTNIVDGLKNADICYIAVGTPMGEDGSADLKYVVNVAKEIGQNMKHHMYIIDKSTVPVGTAKLVRATVQKELDKRKSKLTFDVISNPEFLKEGSAVEDFSKPDRIIIGYDNEKAKNKMKQLYTPLVKNNESIIYMDIASAEMTKYAANSMLATKISFMNEIANICASVGADVNKVRLGMGADHRIGYSFIYPGCGYGGSCFPKDVNALIRTSTQNKYNPELLKSVDSVNKKQKHVLVKMVKTHYKNNVKGKTFAIWGLAFKPNTDDMREAPSLVLISELVKLGAKVQVYDPKAIDMAKNVYFKNTKNVKYAKNKEETLRGADALILVTEWKEFRNPNFKKMAKTLKKPVIFDGRNQYNNEYLKELGFTYHQIGVKN